MIDRDGDVFGRVIEYLRPLGQQARKWPEDAFVGFMVDFLYEVALASKYKTPIASNRIGVVRQFVPIIESLASLGGKRGFGWLSVFPLSATMR